MKILFVVEHFPSFSETFVLNEVTGLLDLGHDVWIYAVGNPSAPVEYPDVEKYELKKRIIPNAQVPVSRLQRFVGVLKWLPSLLSKCGPAALHVFNPSRHGKKALNLGLFYSCIPLLRCDTDFDAIHCHFGDKGALALVWEQMGLISGPISTVFHAHELCRLSDEEGRRLYGPLIRSKTLLLPISQRWQERLISWGALPERTIVHHMGADLQKFECTSHVPPVDGPIRILTVARLVEQKGYEYAIRAIACLRTLTSRDLKYTIIGAGDGGGNLADSLRQLVDELKIADIVTFAGPQPQDKVRESIREANIFLLPSVTTTDGFQEGIPVALMEAMASGLPVVTTRHSGIPELVEDRVSGFLAEERAVAPLAEAMVGVIEDHALAGRIATAARAKVEAEFNLLSLNRRLGQILESEAEIVG